MPQFRHASLLLLSASLFCGCSHTQPVETIAKNGGLYNNFVPAAKTSIVGSVDTVNLYSAYAIIDRVPSHGPFAVGSFLVTRDANQNPTAVIETTKQFGRSTPSQGVLIVSGQPKAGEEVLEPGPELANLVQENIDKYLVDHSAPAEAKAPEMANPPAPAADATTAPTTTAAPATDTPAPATTTTTGDAAPAK